MSIKIGLTGPTGAGKSAVRQIAEDMGFNFIDCDILARKAVEKGSSGLVALIEAFGEEILLADGTLNRKKLASVAFSSPSKTQLLNEILLPHIIKLVILEAGESEYVLFDAPTLFESGLNKECDKIIAVTAAKEIRLKRITERDGLSEAEALTRMSAGNPDSFYKENSDYFVLNNGSIEEFQLKIGHILKEIIGGK